MSTFKSTCRVIARVACAMLLMAAPALAYVNDIVLANDASLGFGQVVAGGASGTVIIDTSGNRSATGGVTLGNGLTARPAAFTVTGDADALYAITLPGSATLTSGGDSMSIDAFTHDATGVLVGGSETFNVGATLHVSGGQPSGDYAGSFSVVVTYQ